MNILNFEHVSFHYPYNGSGFRDKENALNDITFSVEKNSRTVLLGSNGAGKSTLLLHCNGILKPQSGTILIHEKPLQYSHEGLSQLRTKIALVFQDPREQLIAPTLAQDVALGPRNCGKKENEVRQAVEHALASVHLTEYKNYPIHMLSHGMKKRAAIAGALAMEPELLILDEPTAGLDHENQRQLLRTLSDLYRNGITIFCSTHDIDFALRFSDEVCILNKGKLAACGSSSEIFSNETILQQNNLPIPPLVKIKNILYKSEFDKKELMDYINSEIPALFGRS